MSTQTNEIPVEGENTAKTHTSKTRRSAEIEIREKL